MLYVPHPIAFHLHPFSHPPSCSPSTSDFPLLESFACVSPVIFSAAGGPTNAMLNAQISHSRSDTVSINSIRAWLKEVLNKKPGPDGSLDFSLYEQSRTFDIQTNTLGLLYAQVSFRLISLRLSFVAEEGETYGSFFLASLNLMLNS